MIESVEDLQELSDSEILVTTKTDPDWEPALKRAAAIVTDRGGRTCHAAIISRESGIPAVVGTGDGTRKIKTGEWITVSTAEGEEGFVYQGVARFRTERIEWEGGAPLRTRVMLNIGRSDGAFRHAQLPNDGVGLARMEFMISSGVGIHPMALVRFEDVKDPETRLEIEKRTKGFEKKEDYYIRKLSEEIGTIAAAFHPKPVILRLSDFKSNEYSGLLGGKEFEETEENPMLGFRGAFRYSHPSFSAGFRLECEAIKRVRMEMGLQNLKIMVPFVRTIEDSRNAIQELKKNGLQRGDADLEIWMMCEIPSNVILAREFLREYDGFSIGSNDLTQLILGVDRDSVVLSTLFHEQDPAVLSMIREVIRTVRSEGKPIGICGQAPSDHPDFAAFLVREGISSVSLSPDSMVRIRPVLESAEKEVGMDEIRKCNVILAVDPFEKGLEPSRFALKELKNWARKLGSRVEAVHVIADSDQNPGFNHVYTRAYDLLHDRVRRMNLGVPVRVKVIWEHRDLIQHPAHTLVDYARDSKADLILVSSHGRKWLSRTVMGSFAEKVLLSSPVPVVFFGRTPDHHDTWRRVLFATDFSDSSRLAFLKFLRQIGPIHPEVVILHVAEYPNFVTGMSLTGVGAYLPEAYWKVMKESLISEGRPG